MQAAPRSEAAYINTHVVEFPAGAGAPAVGAGVVWPWAPQANASWNNASKAGAWRDWGGLAIRRCSLLNASLTCTPYVSDRSRDKLAKKSRNAGRHRALESMFLMVRGFRRDISSQCRCSPQR